MKNVFRRRVEWIGALLTLALATIAVPRNAAAQDQQGDDPPSRVARLGYMEGSVSFDPEGQGESTGNGQTFTLHRGQKGTFSGTETLNAEVDNIGEPDQFDNWAYQREHRYEGSRSAHYLSPDVVGYEDLDDNGDWRDESNYGHVWFPNHVEANWAPYHN